MGAGLLRGDCSLGDEAPTLLFGDRQNTTSECTFRLRSRSSSRSFTALNTAESA